VALPSGPAPAPTPLPELTLAPWPTSTPTPFPTEAPPATTVPDPTEPIIGPVLPTATQAITPSVTVTPTLALTATATVTITPALPVRPTATPAADLPAFKFAVAGDSRGNPKVYGRVLAAVLADGSEFLVHTGDLVDDGTESLWLEFEEVMDGFSLPFYAVPGNHDGLDGKLTGYLAHSRAPAAHYSFDQGLVHFTLADSHNGGIGASELDWLRQDLSATAQPVKVVVLHHPPFDPDGTNHIMAYGQEAFMALMVEQQVGYVFAGHIHAYAQAERDGVLYTITGGAGAPLYAQDHPEAYYHYLHVTVDGDQVDIQVVEI
jgi:Icc protein